MGQCVCCTKCRRQPSQHEVIVHLDEVCLSQPISNPDIPIALEDQGPSERLLVAAIDIGTTFSGYAFSFLHEYLSDPMRISTNNWPHENGMSMKAPTSILLSPDGNLKAFGYEAISKFGDLAENNQHQDHYFFDKFKMNLYQSHGLGQEIFWVRTCNFGRDYHTLASFDVFLSTQNLSTEFILSDINGKTMVAVDVFAKTILYFKQHLEQRVRECLDSSFKLSTDDVQWVVTVPAIWDDKAKFFMRKAAEKAGIEGRNLTLAIEPEAASLYCQHLPTYKPAVHHYAEKFDVFRPKNKYMVVDLGGGTVDITVHRVLENGALEEVYQPTGGPWGGSTVDDEFRALLVSIFGLEVFEEFKNQFTADVVDLLQAFELKKRFFEPDKDTPLSLKLPMSLVDHYKHRSGQDFQGLLKTKFNGEIMLIQDKLRVFPKTFNRLFNKSISCIVRHIQSLLEKEQVSGVSVLLLVGGYAESRVVRDSFETHFPNLQIIHPPESAASILKGAVLFGHDPHAIVARVCKYTYGIAMMAPFKEGLSDPRKKRIINGELICDDVFDVHLSVGERVSLYDIRPGKEYSLHRGQSHSLLEVYASSVPHPEYVTDNSCTRLGSLVLEVPPDTHENDKIVVCLYYSGTELGVSAFNLKTKQKTKTYFDFLG